MVQITVLRAGKAAIHHGSWCKRKTSDCLFTSDIHSTKPVAKPTDCIYMDKKRFAGHYQESHDLWGQATGNQSCLLMTSQNHLAILNEAMNRIAPGILISILTPRSSNVYTTNLADRFKKVLNATTTKDIPATLLNLQSWPQKNHHQLHTMPMFPSSR